MSTGNLNFNLFVNDLLETCQENTVKIKESIKKRYPSLNEKEVGEISSLVLLAKKTKVDNSVSLAVTAPPSFSINAKSTKNTVDSMIRDAQKSILITGYSLSEYFDDLIDVIIQKSQTGVFVQFFVNDIESQTNVERLTLYRGKFMRIYNYIPKENDKLSALHAKVLSVDGKKTLISSANLSYHGQEGNIELGAIIESEKIAEQVKNLLTTLVNKRVFVEYK